MSPEEANALFPGTLPGLIGMELTEIDPGRRVAARLDLRGDHLAPNGYLHGSTVTTLAETACGFGAWTGHRDGFTTIELKCNFVGTARDGAITCEATRVHGGRTTEVWDATVTSEGNGRVIALFRCTQFLLGG